jgi:tetratricopeptide (TPR) repeat protein
MNWLIAFFLPLVGGGFVWLLQRSFQNKEAALELYKEFVKDDTRNLFKAERQRDVYTASITDILLFEDVATRRDAVMRIFNSDSLQYVKELKKALADPDTEVSHYASSALTEIKRKFDNSVIELSKLVQEDDSLVENKVLYARTLHDYIESGILDPANRRKYQKQFCDLILHLFTVKISVTDGMDMNFYKDTALYLQDLGKSKEAMSFINDCLTVFDHEVIYFAALELYYILGERDLFQQIIRRIRTSRVQLSPEKLASFRYFFDPQLGYEEVAKI